MNSITFKRPSLPREFYNPFFLGSGLYILYSLALCVIPAFLSGYFAAAQIPLLLKIPLITFFILLAGHGLLLIGWVGHEGSHLSLFRNKILSVATGIFFASMIPGYLEIGFAISHWNHHRYTNQPSDPDLKLFARFKGFWPRAFLARIASQYEYLKNTLNIALNRPLGFTYNFPFKNRTVIFLAWMNLIFSLTFLSIYFFILFKWPVWALFSIILPGVTCYLLSSLQPYLQHAGTSVGTLRNTRTIKSSLMTILYFGNNYHLEHHLYPGVPCYRLPKLHRVLKQKGLYKEGDSFIEISIKGAYSHATSFSPYSTGQWENCIFNPMIQAVDPPLKISSMGSQELV